MNKPTIIVTGAAGFIGSHASQALLAHGYRVVGIDNFCDFYDRAWKELNIAPMSGDDFHLEEIDICDRTAIARVFESAKPDAVLHLAGMAGVRPSIEQPAYYAQVNVEGTINVLDAAARHKVGKFLFASSSSVYGNQKQIPFREDEPVAEPISPYAATKRAGELLCYTFWHLYRMPCFCFRFFTVYGPRLRPDLAIHKFTRLITRGKPIPFFGDGSTSRDYTYVDDICQGLIHALDRCDRYRIYNLGNHHPVDLAQMVKALELAIGKPAQLQLLPMQPGDVELTCADISRAQAELDYHPHVSLEAGLTKFVRWFNESGHLYKLAGE